jgi:hypothetical protein
MVYGSERSDFSTCSVVAQKIGNGAVIRWKTFAAETLQTGKLLRDA